MSYDDSNILVSSEENSYDYKGAKEMPFCFMADRVTCNSLKKEIFSTKNFIEYLLVTRAVYFRYFRELYDMKTTRKKSYETCNKNKRPVPRLAGNNCTFLEMLRSSRLQGLTQGCVESVV